MIIEFVGLMGAGKTTLHRQAAERLAKLDRRCWTPKMVASSCGAGPDSAQRIDGVLSSAILARSRRLAFRLKASWWSRQLVSLAVQQLCFCRQPHRDRLRRFRWVLTALGNHWTARLKVPREDIVLFDEGLVQRAITVFVHGKKSVDVSRLRCYPRAIPLPDILIYLRVDPEVARARVLRRPSSLARRFRSLSERELRDTFTDTALSLDALVTEIRETAKTVKVVAIDANDIQQAMTALDQEIMTVTGARRDNA